MVDERIVSAGHERCWLSPLPNNALQRTRLRAPLSFEPFGDSRKV